MLRTLCDINTKNGFISYVINVHVIVIKMAGCCDILQSGSDHYICVNDSCLFCITFEE